MGNVHLKYYIQTQTNYLNKIKKHKYTHNLNKNLNYNILCNLLNKGTGLVRLYVTWLRKAKFVRYAF